MLIKLYRHKIVPSKYRANALAP